MSTSKKLFKLRNLRKQLHITQKEVADILNVTVQFYSQIERGINVLSYENAVKIARYFNTSTDLLFEEDTVGPRNEGLYINKDELRIANESILK